jgi:spermidine synthase
MNDFTRTMRQQFDQMLAWTARSQSDVKSCKPYITKRHGNLALHFDHLSVQSEMAMDMPDELVLSYTRVMMSFLLLDPSPKHITMIGLGGGSLAKYCYRHLPKTKITVIEINPDVIALRNEFAIPPDDARFKVLLDDGAAFVSAPDNGLQVLIVDGFDSGGQPAQLGSQRFYDDCFASLANNGSLVVNLWGSNPNYNEYLARIKNSFSGRVAVVVAKDGLNKIVLAVKSAGFEPSATTIRQHANLLSLSHSLNFQAKADKLISAFCGYANRSASTA